MTAVPRLQPGHEPQGAFVPSAWIGDAEFAAVRFHPSLPAAVARFCNFLIESYGGSPVLNLVLSDRGRLLVSLFVSYLDAVPSALGGAAGAGATLGAVQTMCRRTGLCSSGRAAALLAGMRFGGYVVSGTDAGDRRRRLIAPTQKLVAIQTANWSRQFESMVPVFSQAASVPSALQRPAFRTGFLAALGAHYLDGFRLCDHVPVLAELTECNAGLLTLVSLAVPVFEGGSGSGEPVPVSVSALARRFCVSRAQVRKLLRSAEAKGLIARTSEPERIVVLPALPDAVLAFYTVLFSFFHCCAEIAFADERRWRERPPADGDLERRARYSAGSAPSARAGPAMRASISTTRRS